MSEQCCIVLREPRSANVRSWAGISTGPIVFGSHCFYLRRELVWTLELLVRLEPT
jgi:hypothetical protein